MLSFPPVLIDAYGCWVHFGLLITESCRVLWYRISQKSWLQRKLGCRYRVCPRNVMHETCFHACLTQVD